MNITIDVYDSVLKRVQHDVEQLTYSIFKSLYPSYNEMINNDCECDCGTENRYELTTHVRKMGKFAFNVSMRVVDRSTMDSDDYIVSFPIGHFFREDNGHHFKNYISLVSTEEWQRKYIKKQ